MRTTLLLGFAAAAPSALAAIKGMNYGANDLSGASQTEAGFEGNFNTAKNLQGQSFTSARLFTSIQGGTSNSPSAAFQAAVNTNTHLLLGIWASAGQTQVDNEIAAIKSAVGQFGSSFTDLIDGISVGSEDVYRITDLGIASGAGAGADPTTIANFVNYVRSAFSGTALSSAPITHVDTYNTYSNSSGWMGPVIDAVDAVSIDAYPYFETTKANSIENANATFWGDYDAVVGVANGKPVWVTETGWPTSGPTSGQAVPSVQNAETYYSEVACSAFARGINIWWYTLQDSSADASVPSFGVTGAGSPPPTTPKYDLSC